jgi:uncharacterized membrane protein
MSHAASSTGLRPATAATLAYLAGPFSGVLILLAETTNPDVRFHAWQSILGLGGLGVLLAAALGGAAGAVIVSAGLVTTMVVVATVVWGVLFVVWLVCLWKASRGGRFRLPLVGAAAARRATSLSGRAR